MPDPVVLENRFDVPPDYAAKWLTDFRSDDAQRYFGNRATVTLTKKGNETFSEGPHQMGWSKGVAIVDSPTTWHASTEFSKNKGGAVFMRGTVKESVRAEGKGTLHRAEVGVEPLTFGTKLLFGTIGKGMMTKSLKDGFAKIKSQMEADYKAGKPPTG
ncbi:MAG: hypothetical protein LC624_04475 [Halobacteriales archaeon]|nr:hypothetical protein [Halobacteriales archaeon]